MSIYFFFLQLLKILLVINSWFRVTNRIHFNIQTAMEKVLLWLGYLLIHLVQII